MYDQLQDWDLGNQALLHSGSLTSFQFCVYFPQWHWYLAKRDKRQAGILRKILQHFFPKHVYLYTTVLTNVSMKTILLKSKRQKYLFEKTNNQTTLYILSMGSSTVYAVSTLLSKRPLSLEQPINILICCAETQILTILLPHILHWSAVLTQSLYRKIDW